MDIGIKYTESLSRYGVLDFFRDFSVIEVNISLLTRDV